MCFNPRRATLQSLVALVFTPAFAFAWQTSVSISYVGWPTITWTAVAPGFCCVAPHPWWYGARGEFNSLPLGAIAAFWEDLRPRDSALSWGCGRTLDTHYGNPDWTYFAPAPQRLSGASYIQCPGKTASLAQWSEVGWLGVLLGFCTRKIQRTTGSRVTAGIEATWGYPDIVSVNGTNYTDGRRGDLVYRNEEGNVLDLDTLSSLWVRKNR